MKQGTHSGAVLMESGLEGDQTDKQGLFCLIMSSDVVLTYYY